MSINTFLGGLAGLAGGASQGLQQVQENKQRQLQMQLQQRQQQMVEEDRKRRAVMEARQMLSGGMKVQPEQIQEWSQFPEALTGIEKQADGTFLVAKSPSERQMDLIIKDLEIKGRENQDRLAAKEEWDKWGQEIYNQPIEYRLALASRIGDKNLLTQTPEEELQYNARIKGEEIKAQAAMARAYASANNQQEMANLRFQHQLELLQARGGQVSDQDLLKMILSEKNVAGMPMYTTREQIQQRMQELRGLLGSQNQLQSQPQAAAGIARNLRRVQ